MSEEEVSQTIQDLSTFHAADTFVKGVFEMVDEAIADHTLAKEKREEAVRAVITMICETRILRRLKETNATS